MPMENCAPTVAHADAFFVILTLPPDHRPRPRGFEAAVQDASLMGILVIFLVLIHVTAALYH
jgi:cytochrome b561